MPDTNWLSNFAFLGGMVIFTPLSAEGWTFGIAITTASVDSTVRQHQSYSDTSYYLLPIDIDDGIEHDYVTEIPAVKRMVFKFGKPREKRFFV